VFVVDTPLEGLPITRQTMYVHCLVVITELCNGPVIQFGACVRCVYVSGKSRVAVWVALSSWRN